MADASQHLVSDPSEDTTAVPRPASPTAQRLVSALSELVTATLRDDASAAAHVLDAIGQRRVEVERRQGVSTAVRVGVHRRDCWTCRYCRLRTIAPPVLRFLSEIYADEFPYHRNWKAGQVHPAFLLLSTSLDHVNPGGRGGDWRADINLVTACWPCNTGKADLRLDEVGWRLLDQEDVHSDWDGLSGTTNQLWERAGRPEICRDWRRALGG